jgi:hypothetical protein
MDMKLMVKAATEFLLDSKHGIWIRKVKPNKFLYVVQNETDEFLCTNLEWSFERDSKNALTLEQAVSLANLYLRQLKEEA